MICTCLSSSISNCLHRHFGRDDTDGATDAVLFVVEALVSVVVCPHPDEIPCNDFLQNNQTVYADDTTIDVRFDGVTSSVENGDRAVELLRQTIQLFVSQFFQASWC